MKRLRLLTSLVCLLPMPLLGQGQWQPFTVDIYKSYSGGDNGQPFVFSDYAGTITLPGMYPDLTFGSSYNWHYWRPFGLINFGLDAHVSAWTGSDNTAEFDLISTGPSRFIMDGKVVIENTTPNPNWDQAQQIRSSALVTPPTSAFARTASPDVAPGTHQLEIQYHSFGETGGYADIAAGLDFWDRSGEAFGVPETTGWLLWLAPIVLALGRIGRAVISAKK